MKIEDIQVLEFIKNMIMDSDYPLHKRLAIKTTILDSINSYDFLSEEDKDLYKDEIESLDIFATMYE